MTDKEWSRAKAEIESLHFQLVNNIMPSNERRELKVRLRLRIIELADRIIVDS